MQNEKKLGFFSLTMIVISLVIGMGIFKTGINKIELVHSKDENGVINKFIEKRGEGIHHIAFAVADIKAEMERMQNEGFDLLTPEPKKGADNKLVAFLHPKKTNGVLIELCQEAPVA